MSQTIDSWHVRWSAERRFHLAFILILLGAVFLGFSRTFFLRPWFREWADVHGAPEPFFYFHGAVFAGWFVLLLAQSSLVAAGRVDLHRRLGQLGAGLAVVMVVLGVTGGLIAARRPTGFIDVALPPLQFLVVPFVSMAQFAVLVALALVKRRSVQSHKRYMLLASVSLIGAAVTRWPFSIMAGESPVPGFSTSDLVGDLFLLPMVAWDFASRGRLHPVTLWGGLALIALQPLSFVVSQTDAWLAFAGWAVSLIG